MKRIYASLAVVTVLGSGLSLAPAHGAPPTVTPSPGYDARLQEQRAAQTVYVPVAPTSRPLRRHHARRIHDTR